MPKLLIVWILLPLEELLREASADILTVEVVDYRKTNV